MERCCNYRTNRVITNVWPSICRTVCPVGVSDRNWSSGHNTDCTRHTVFQETPQRTKQSTYNYSEFINFFGRCGPGNGGGWGASYSMPLVTIMNYNCYLPSLLHLESTFRRFSFRSWNKLILSSSHGVLVRVIIPANTNTTLVTATHVYRGRLCLVCWESETTQSK
jgi:hypothetical protein